MTWAWRLSPGPSDSVAGLWVGGTQRCQQDRYQQNLDLGLFLLAGLGRVPSTPLPQFSPSLLSPFPAHHALPGSLDPRKDAAVASSVASELGLDDVRASSVLCPRAYNIWLRTTCE